jgi:hypothetical protein
MYNKVLPHVGRNCGFQTLWLRQRLAADVRGRVTRRVCEIIAQNVTQAVFVKVKE